MVRRRKAALRKKLRRKPGKRVFGECKWCGPPVKATRTVVIGKRVHPVHGVQDNHVPVCNTCRMRFYRRGTLELANQRSLTPEDLVQARTMAEAGCTVREIADELGVSKSTVSYRLTNGYSID